MVGQLVAGAAVGTGVSVGADLCASFVLESPWGSAPVTLGVRGVHNVGNALAAAAAPAATTASAEKAPTVFTRTLHPSELFETLSYPARVTSKLNGAEPKS